MLSVNAYNSNSTIREQCMRLTKEELKKELCEENPGIDYDGMVLAMTEVLRELFRDVAPSVGEWPRSSAYYAVDIMFDSDCCTENLGVAGAGVIPTPKLLEVNYMGDWKGMQWSCNRVAALASVDKASSEGVRVSSEFSSHYVDFVQDFVRCVATTEAMDSTRNYKL
jgi:hypothetical protein